MQRTKRSPIRRCVKWPLEFDWLPKRRDPEFRRRSFQLSGFGLFRSHQLSKLVRRDASPQKDETQPPASSLAGDAVAREPRCPPQSRTLGRSIFRTLSGRAASRKRASVRLLAAAPPRSCMVSGSSKCLDLCRTVSAPRGKCITCDTPCARHRSFFPRWRLRPTRMHTCRRCRSQQPQPVGQSLCPTAYCTANTSLHVLTRRRVGTTASRAATYAAVPVWQLSKGDHHFFSALGNDKPRTLPVHAAAPGSRTITRSRSTTSLQFAPVGATDAAAAALPKVAFGGVPLAGASRASTRILRED